MGRKLQSAVWNSESEFSTLLPRKAGPRWTTVGKSESTWAIAQIPMSSTSGPRKATCERPGQQSELLKDPDGTEMPCCELLVFRAI